MPTNIIKTRWYRELIARMQPQNCSIASTWTYLNYWNCRYYEILFIFFSTFPIGAVFGVMRAYNYFEISSEQKFISMPQQGKKSRFLSKLINHKKDSTLKNNNSEILTEKEMLKFTLTQRVVKHQFGAKGQRRRFKSTYF